MERLLSYLLAVICAANLVNISLGGESQSSENIISLSVNSVRSDDGEWATSFLAHQNTSVQPRNVDVNVTRRFATCQGRYIVQIGGSLKVNEGESCRTPIGERGNCVRIGDCLDYSILLDRAEVSSIPPAVLSHLRLAKCGKTAEKKALLCCPENGTRKSQGDETDRNGTIKVTCNDKAKHEELQKLLTAKDTEIASKVEEIERLRSFLTLGKEYELYPDIGYYKHYRNAVDFATASNTCKKEGAHLLIVNSYKEENAIREIMNKSGNAAIWTGIHDPLKNRQFKTIFGTPLNETGYSRWQNGEPNNNEGDEFCVDFQYNYGGLNDLGCAHQRPFICEFEI